MSAKAKPEGLLGLSNTEQKILLLSILCTDETNKLDLEKLAQYGGYKNSASASTTYRNAKRKLSDYKPDQPTSAEASTANTPKRGRPSKKAIAADPPASTEPESAEAEEATPAHRAKRQRGTKKGIARKVNKNSYDDEDSVRTEPSSPETVIRKEEDVSIKEESPIKTGEIVVIKQEEGGKYECKSEDETPMTCEELDAELDAMDKASQEDIKAKVEDDA
ncbi:hypothetical protein BDV23DRAFT_179457 [Aspergillus alliaceus]|uniref:Histone h1.3 n=1 Tax=Petromyces alliaceus TaxID=209559 RepID=A0A5N7CLK8_PETAA|nr:hypothetical protein BDV23DRAFT_179457 [Aspergillus alliaceus]